MSRSTIENWDLKMEKIAVQPKLGKLWPGLTFQLKRLTR